jgi:hypothetical protein
VKGLNVPHHGIIVGFELQSKDISLDNPFGIERIPVAEIISVQCVD